MGGTEGRAPSRHARPRAPGLEPLRRGRSSSHPCSTPGATSQKTAPTCKPKPVRRRVTNASPYSRASQSATRAARDSCPSIRKQLVGPLPTNDCATLVAQPPQRPAGPSRASADPVASTASETRRGRPPTRRSRGALRSRARGPIPPTPWPRPHRAPFASGPPEGRERISAQLSQTTERSPWTPSRAGAHSPRPGSRRALQHRQPSFQESMPDHLRTHITRCRGSRPRRGAHQARRGGVPEPPSLVGRAEDRSSPTRRPEGGSRIAAREEAVRVRPQGSPAAARMARSSSEEGSSSPSGVRTGIATRPL